MDSVNACLSKNGHLKVTEALLGKQTDPNLSNNNGFNACFSKYPDAFLLLNYCLVNKLILIFQIKMDLQL